MDADLTAIKAALADVNATQLTALITATNSIPPHPRMVYSSRSRGSATWDLNRRVGHDYELLPPEAAIDPSEDAISIDAAMVLRDQFAGIPDAALGDALTETQPTDPMIVRYWSSPNALRVVVRMLPPLAIEMASLANSSSFGASMITTMSKPPIVM